MSYHITTENVSKHTRAEARRWLDAHLGTRLDTVQKNEAGVTIWAPGPRTLTRGRTQVTWALDGSEVRLSTAHRIWHISQHLLVLGWYDEDGSLIHITNYAAMEAVDHQGHDTWPLVSRPGTTWCRDCQQHFTVTS